MGSTTPESGPPKVIERLAGFLLPPACREHVLGDLRERCANGRQYVMEAIFTVPRVIESRIRRTANPPVLLLAAMEMYLSFVGAASWYGEMRFLYEEDGLLRLALPVAAVVIALVLLDAYAGPGERSPSKPVRHVVLALAFAFLSQFALQITDDRVAAPRAVLLTGVFMSLLLVSALRILFAPLDHRSKGAG